MSEREDRSHGLPSTALFTVGAWGLIAAALVLVGTSFAPALARELGLTEMRVVTRDFQRTSPKGQAGVDAVRDFERDIGRSVDRLERSLPDDADEPVERILTVTVKKPLLLRKSPSAKSPSGISVPAFSEIGVLTAEGSWLQVKYQAPDKSIHFGWIELSELELP